MAAAGVPVHMAAAALVYLGAAVAGQQRMVLPVPIMETRQQLAHPMMQRAYKAAAALVVVLL